MTKVLYLKIGNLQNWKLKLTLVYWLSARKKLRGEDNRPLFLKK